MCALYRWLDKLGLAASLGLGVVMRQVFFGAGSYHLVDANLDPLPVRICLHFDVCLMHAPTISFCVVSIFISGIYG